MEASSSEYDTIILVFLFDKVRVLLIMINQHLNKTAAPLYEIKYMNKKEKRYRNLSMN